jgi:membrane-bound metal-dependent hydrolase YbcI (DUF457 family)
MGYLIARGLSRPLKLEGYIDYRLVMFLSILPEIDNFSPFEYATPLGHHGITHSWMLATIVALPFLAIWRTVAIPYYVAYVQHILLGDLLANAVPLLAPLTYAQYGVEMSRFLFKELVALESALVLLFAIKTRFSAKIPGNPLSTICLAGTVPLFLLMIRDSIRPLTYGRTESAYGVFGIASALYFMWVIYQMAKNSFSSPGGQRPAEG